MKKILLPAGLIFFISCCVEAQQNYGENYAIKVAHRMKDSLSLSEEQRVQLYNINMRINNQKADVWQKYGSSDSLIAVHLQPIENSRDSLYRPVLGEKKYILYRTKKRNLISNN